MNLKIDCLGRTALPFEWVEGVYVTAKAHPAADNVEIIKKLALSHERLRADLDGASFLQAEAEQQLAEFVEMNAGMKEGFSERLADIQNEIKSVLMLMDGLAEQWGDEGVFRRCRDRLRALVERM